MAVLPTAGIRRRAASAPRPVHPADRPQRHPGDLLRVALGLVVLGIGFLIAQQGQLSPLERDLFRLVNDLPGFFFPVVWAVMQLGNVVAVPTLAAVAALTRRFRLARDLLLSGLLAYYAADLVKSVVGRERPSGLPVGAVLHEGVIGGAGFISGHAAVAAAMATAAAPYLTRRWRRVVWALAWTVGLARIYVGAHLPLDVVGGLAAGWAIGSAVHWVLGVPRWRPRPERVAAQLARYGLPVQDLRPVAAHARSSHPFTAVDGSGRRVFVKVLDPHRYERDWFYRLARLLAVRDVKDADALAPLGRQAEHEAVAAFTARARGVRVPEVLLARGNDRGAVVAQQYLPGRPLDELPPEELTPPLLDRVWEQVALLHRARIAHRDLVASSIVVDDRGRPWLVDFGNAETGADDRTLAGDVAELMASLSLRTDVRAVVAAAIGRLGPEAVGAALPELAPLALSSATRAALRSTPAGITPLRVEVRRRLELPDPSRLQFGPAGPLAWVTIGAAAVVVLGGLAWLTGLTGLADTVELNGWRWLGGAVALAVLARGALAAAAVMAVDRRLALGRVFAATIAVDGALLRRGPVDRRRVAARFLERSGVLPAAAERAVDRYDVGTVLAGVVAAAGAIVLALLDGVLVDWRPPEQQLGTVLIGAAGFVLVALGQVLAARHGGPAAPSPLHRRLLGLPDRGWRDDGPADLRSWAAQLAWTALGILLEASALAAALHGLRGDIPVLTTAALYTVLRLLWAGLPVLGAPGLAEAALLLALTAAGAPSAAAGGAVLAVRVLTFWLPAVLGWALSGRLEHRLLL
ncbi:phosphatase PAP2 family protein [Petropleomorpha daqingensis]|uniref:Undecaprenyl-diphosphatase n=1 Tax=Petropleomorpha daqingensis TaxID=2026353 RepID=A0A853CPN9_9ACTN|nr:phosphatase PAP2 family protein [Petropleomorpha daqingensis]NYJ08749.1 undecaprenyl-diphosphatase [Petropleomorpha daqingensis]